MYIPGLLWDKALLKPHSVTKSKLRVAGRNLHGFHVY